MSGEENAQVLQTKLAWEPGDITEITPEEIQPHPKNREIYGDTNDPSNLDETFIESVGEKGVLEPVVITEDKTLISGHRRVLAAQANDLDTIPARISEFESELAKREAVIEFNRQREKTPGQVVNEFEEMLAIEKARAKERTKEAGSVGGKSNTEEGSGNVSKPLEDTGSARDKAAEKINADVSGRTLEKGKEVKDKAESDDEPEEVREKAQEAWEGLQSGEESFNSAYETVKDAENDVEGENTDDKDASHDLDVLTSQDTDEWSSPREIVEPLDESLNGFDLDPCSGAEQSPFATDTITEEENGLDKDWLGTVWVNPPYSKVSVWVDKAITEVQNDNSDTIAFLCKGDSSTDWWQRAARESTAICTIDHRLSFGDGENSAPFASHIIMFGEATEEVIKQLQEYGVVLRRFNNGQ